MLDQLPEGFLPKPEALEKYRKPERTFQRRLAKALQIQNDNFLNHFYLVTSDNKIRKGSTVQPGDAGKLKATGLYPVWFVEEKWFAEEYDRKAQSASKISTNPTPPDTTGKDRSTLDRGAIVAEIESLNRELTREREHNALITGQLNIKDEQIQAANKIVIESNQREKEYSSLLKELAGRIPSLDSGTSTNNHKETTVVKAEAQPVHEAEAIEVEIVPTKKRPQAKKASPTKSKKKPASATKKSQSSIKKTPQPKWYQIPTVRRIFKK